MELKFSFLQTQSLFNMGENKSLCYMNEILLAEVHCDFMHVKIFDCPVFIFILKTEFLQTT